MRLSTIVCSLVMLVGACAAEDPEPAASQDQGLIVVGGGQCGPRVCAAGLHCCNASCGTCVPPGVECTQQACKADEAAAMTEEESRSLIIIGGGQCGDHTCGAGSYCCNASCGTCARFGDFCTQQICNPTD